MREFIYLATPYNDPDPKVRANRFDNVTKIAALLISNGELVFSPITHAHPIVELEDLPLGWEHWKDFDRKLLSISTKLIVVCLDGWKESEGVTKEIELAEALGIPVSYFELEDHSYGPTSFEYKKERDDTVEITIPSGAKKSLYKLRS